MYGSRYDWDYAWKSYGSRGADGRRGKTSTITFAPRLYPFTKSGGILVAMCPVHNHLIRRGRIGLLKAEMMMIMDTMYLQVSKLMSHNESRGKTFFIHKYCRFRPSTHFTELRISRWSKFLSCEKYCSVPASFLICVKHSAYQVGIYRIKFNESVLYLKINKYI